MPTYEYECQNCQRATEEVRPMDQRDAEVICPMCSCECNRVFAAPHVMTVALPDGTKRFDSVRASRQLEKAIKAEKDNHLKAKLKGELRKLVTKETA